MSAFSLNLSRATASDGSNASTGFGSTAEAVMEAVRRRKKDNR